MSKHSCTKFFKNVKEHPRPGKQKTIFLPFIRSLIASMSHSGAFAFFGGTVFTVNPLAMS